jgi:ADP-dependent phosphofructokinase/glucokinase
MLLKEIDKFWDKICQFPRKITKKMTYIKKIIIILFVGKAASFILRGIIPIRT